VGEREIEIKRHGEREKKRRTKTRKRELKRGR
jgi:hypothetical protein